MPHQYENVIDGEMEEIVSLATDMRRWEGLMPHVLESTVHCHHEAGMLATVRISNYRPIAVQLDCRIRVAKQEGEYRARLRFLGRTGAGLYQNWRFQPREDDRVVVQVYPQTIHGHWPLRTRIINRLVFDPFTVRHLDMIALLAESDRLAHLGVIVDDVRMPLSTTVKNV